jgi:hypothetical protein
VAKGLTDKEGKAQLGRCYLGCACKRDTKTRSGSAKKTARSQKNNETVQAKTGKELGAGARTHKQAKQARRSGGGMVGSRSGRVRKSLELKTGWDASRIMDDGWAPPPALMYMYMRYPVLPCPALPGMLLLLHGAPTNIGT